MTEHRVDLTADLDIYFDDFGVDALIGMEPVRVVFDDPSKQLTVFDGQICSSAPFCSMKSSDVLANNVDNGTLISIGNDDYTVTNVAPDGAGLSVVTLTSDL